MLLHADRPLKQLSDLDIRKAIAHHRRAIAALDNRHTFEGISRRSAEKIILRFESELRALHDELGRRHLEPRPRRKV